MGCGSIYYAKKDVYMGVMAPKRYAWPIPPHSYSCKSFGADSAGAVLCTVSPQILVYACSPLPTLLQYTSSMYGLSIEFANRHSRRAPRGAGECGLGGGFGAQARAREPPVDFIGSLSLLGCRRRPWEADEFTATMTRRPNLPA